MPAGGWNRLHSDDELLAAIKEHGSQIKAIKALGVSRRNFQRRIAGLRARGYAPEFDQTHPVPAGQIVGGVSTLYGEDGKLKLQWVKSRADLDELREIMRECVKAMAEDVRGLAKPMRAPREALAQSLSAYVIGDAHLGLYAWREEAGEDFDTAIASRELRAAIDLLVAGAPASAVGYLVDVGDFLHADSRRAATPQSGNQLDVDTRFQRVIRIAIDAIKYCIGRMLQKHKSVRVFIRPGNHNPDSAGWLALVISAYYERDKRVQVEMSPAEYVYARFGKVLIGITHGDKVKMDQLPAIMATDRAKDWGETQHRYWWTGHIHHTKHQEHRGCFVESFNTLAASDAWHHASGYRSARQMQRIDIDEQHGIYSRGIANIGMLRGD
jgi:hypothetical protein